MVNGELEWCNSPFPTFDIRHSLLTLGVFFWGRKWTLSAWCELRNDFRDFRLDRVRQATMLDETFEEEPGRTLRDLLARYGPNAVRMLDG